MRCPTCKSLVWPEVVSTAGRSGQVEFYCHRCHRTVEEIEQIDLSKKKETVPVGAGRCFDLEDDGSPCAATEIHARSRCRRHYLAFRAQSAKRVSVESVALQRSAQSSASETAMIATQEVVVPVPKCPLTIEMPLELPNSAPARVEHLAHPTPPAQDAAVALSGILERGRMKWVRALVDYGRHATDCPCLAGPPVFDRDPLDILDEHREGQRIHSAGQLPRRKEGGAGVCTCGFDALIHEARQIVARVPVAV